MPDEDLREDSLFSSAVGEWGVSFDVGQIVRLVDPYTTFRVRPGLEFDEDTPRPNVGVIGA